ncbi:MAG TPA: alcohol dehydrogenase catalytic domain-containing protein [Pyrinomonadaceae bacterium]|nr:alcohol dehydrogenase catalytic domain-containing protein [Pyrinomonadaceae bacterium]
MKALRVKGGQVELAEVAKPVADGEALIRVIKSGICNTDLEIARGYAGFEGTIGHEFVGVIEEAGHDAELIGRRVVGEINAGCGQCSLCRAGDPRHCANRTVLGIHGRDGAHAEYLKLPIANLLPVSDALSDIEAVFVEPLAAAYSISERVEITPDRRVAVIGDGKLGILCARSLSKLTDGLTLVGKHRNKLDIAEKYGNVTGVMLAETEDLTRSFDIVVEASGSESGFSTALNLVRPGGKVVLKSTFHGTPTWNATKVVVDEITIVGSRCGRFVPALELLSSGEIEVEDLVSDEYTLADGVAAMARAAESDVLKVLLRM